MARSLVNGTVVEETDVRGSSKNWKEFLVDLSPYAGKKVKIQLENAATGGSWDYGFWSHARLQVYRPA